MGAVGDADAARSYLPSSKGISVRGGGDGLNFVDEGSFSVLDWQGYPTVGNVPKPTGPFRLLEGAEYSAALKLKNAANAALHNNNPALKGLHIHEIHPVKFGGSPTDILNKIFLTQPQHAPYTSFWNKLMYNIYRKP